MGRPKQRRGGRLLRGAVVALLCAAALGGCTTSKAVRHWHSGWQREARGDLSGAAKFYAKAYARDGRLLGAELDRLRLLARQPDQRKAVDTRLKELLKDHPEAVEVQLFAAGWALFGEDSAGALKRLSAVNEVAVAKADRKRAELAAESGQIGGAAGPASAAARRRQVRRAAACGPTRLAWLGLRLRAHAAAKHFAEAKTAADALTRSCQRGPERYALVLASTYLGLGEARKARHMLAMASGKGSAAVRALSAEVAFALDEPARVERLVLRRSDPRALALRAWAQWRQGKSRRAFARASRALRRDTKQLLAVEVQAAAALDAGDLELARAVLRGAQTLLGAESWALSFCAGILAARDGDLDGAAKAFERAAAACPSCAPPRKNLSVLRAALGLQPAKAPGLP